MALEKLKYCAKYPFTGSAKQLISEMNLDFTNISEEYIDFAYQNLLSIMTRKYTKPNEIEISKENFLKKMLVAYPISNIIVNLAKSPALKMKYARFRSLQTRKFLGFENKEIIEKLSNELFDIKENKISYQEYLNAMPNGETFKLIYQDFGNGKIALNDYILKNLLSEKAFGSVMQTKLVKANYPKSIIFYADDIKEKQKSAAFVEDYGKVNTEAFPPCMKKIVTQLTSGEKVGHLPRFVLVTFLVNINMPENEILNLFRDQPNFNESRTKYHIQHAMGKTGAIKYSAPACSKVVSYGVCYKDSTCRWPHPMKYYKLTKDRLERKKK